MKRIIELSENDYKALKEDGVQNHLALANTIIARSIPYEPQIEIVPVCKVIFDKEQLQEIVDKRVAELVADNKRTQGEWKAREDMDYIDENKVVHNHFECNKCGFIHDFIDGHTTQYNFCPKCGKDMRKPNCVTCDHFGDCEGCERSEEE